jgi:hypothetical protein
MQLVNEVWRKAGVGHSGDAISTVGVASCKAGEAGKQSWCCSMTTVSDILHKRSFCPQNRHDSTKLVSQ